LSIGAIRAHQSEVEKLRILASSTLLIYFIRISDILGLNLCALHDTGLPFSSYSGGSDTSFPAITLTTLRFAGKKALHSYRSSNAVRLDSSPI